MQVCIDSELYKLRQSNLQWQRQQHCISSVVMNILRGQERVRFSPVVISVMYVFKGRKTVAPYETQCSEKIGWHPTDALYEDCRDWYHGISKIALAEFIIPIPTAIIKTRLCSEAFYSLCSLLGYKCANVGVDTNFSVRLTSQSLKWWMYKMGKVGIIYEKLW